MSDFIPLEPTALQIPEACDHPSVDIRAYTCSNGVIQYVKQCLVCGEKVGNPISHADVFAARGDLRFIAKFDEALRDKGRAARDLYRQTMPLDERIAQRAIAKAEAFESQRAKLGDWYRDEYLDSPQWAERRSLVLHRAGGICEGCRSRKASVVHHLTYDHVGNELLFELVALCRGCHDRCHGVA
jgi:hypothetical protein